MNDKQEGKEAELLPCFNRGCISSRPYMNDRYAECLGCGVQGPRGKTRTESVELWNNLPRQPELSELERKVVDGVRELHKNYDLEGVYIQDVGTSIRKNGKDYILRFNPKTPSLICDKCAHSEVCKFKEEVEPTDKECDYYRAASRAGKEVR
jgi:hypothetical protein